MDSTSGNPNRKMKTRFGNFLPDSLHSGFDGSFFHISPREARALDPQMRVLMRVGLEAAEAAGLVVDEFSMDSSSKTDTDSTGVLRSEDVGCFVGVATNDYPHNLRNDLGVHYATGMRVIGLAAIISLTAVFAYFRHSSRVPRRPPRLFTASVWAVDGARHCVLFVARGHSSSMPRAARWRLQGCPCWRRERHRQPGCKIYLHIMNLRY